MKNLKLFWYRIRYGAAALMLALTGGLSASAAGAEDPKQLLEAGTKELLATVGSVLTIVMVICAVSGAVSVAWALIDRKNAQEGANQRLMNTGIGLVVAFLILAVLKLVLNRLGAN